MNPYKRSSHWIYKLDKHPETKHLKLVEHSTKEPKCLCRQMNGVVAAIELDVYGFITAWSAQAEEVYGYERNEMLGKHFASLYTTEDLEHEKPITELQEMESRGAYFSFSWQKRKSGEQFWTYSEIQAKKDGGGTVKGYRKCVVETPTCIAKGIPSEHLETENKADRRSCG